MRAARRMAEPAATGVESAERLSRHALVMTVWLPAGVSGLLLIATGYRLVSPGYVTAGFIALLAGFAGHVLIDVLRATRFTAREVALWLVSYGLGVVGFMLAWLLEHAAARALFVPTALGLMTIPLAVALYLIIRFGVRRAFESFDVISNFRV